MKMPRGNITKQTAVIGGLKAEHLFINGTEVVPAPATGATPLGTEVHNGESSTLAVGTLVYIAGWDTASDRPMVMKADASSAATAAQYVVTTAILTGAVGTVYGQATVANIKTDLGAAGVGDPVYLSETAGAFTQTAPLLDTIAQVVGVFATIHATTGTIVFYPEKGIIALQGGTRLSLNQTNIAPATDASMFYMYGTHAFGTAAGAVGTDLGAAPCKMEVVSAKLNIIVPKAGGVIDDTTWIAKEAIGTTAMTDVATLDMSDVLFQNIKGSIKGIQGLVTADARVLAGEHIYVHTAAAAGRTAGTYHVVVLCKKIA
jgi:hypothetical protein